MHSYIHPLTTDPGEGPFPGSTGQKAEIHPVHHWAHTLAHTIVLQRQILDNCQSVQTP